MLHLNIKKLENELHKDDLTYFSFKQKKTPSSPCCLQIVVYCMQKNATRF